MNVSSEFIVRFEKARKELKQTIYSDVCRNVDCLFDRFRAELNVTGIDEQITQTYIDTNFISQPIRGPSPNLEFNIDVKSHFNQPIVIDILDDEDMPENNTNVSEPSKPNKHSEEMTQNEQIMKKVNQNKITTNRKGYMKVQKKRKISCPRKTNVISHSQVEPNHNLLIPGSNVNTSTSGNVSLQSSCSNQCNLNVDCLPKFKTVALKCFYCELIVQNKEILDQHLKVSHNVLPYRCLHVDCKQSFPIEDDLSHHLLVAHSDLVQWKCAQCQLEQADYSHLALHTLLHHEEGHFTCTKENCNISARNRIGVLTHFAEHPLFACSFDGCTKAFGYKAILEKHEATHPLTEQHSIQLSPFKCGPSNNKHPKMKRFQCQWPHCDFINTKRAIVINHIRTKHLKQPARPSKYIVDHKVNQKNPEDFIVQIDM